MGVAKALAVTTNGTSGGDTGTDDPQDSSRETVAHIAGPLFTVLVMAMLSVLM